MRVLDKVELDDDVWQKLSAKAGLRHLPVSAIAAELLAVAVRSDDDVEAALLLELERGRERLPNVVVTDNDINEAKWQGRK